MQVLNRRDFQGKPAPANSVYIGRPSKWGNPFRIGRQYDGTRAEVLNLYETWLRRRLRANPSYLDELKGKDLVCWCAPLPCHGDVIVRVIEEMDASA